MQSDQSIPDYELRLVCPEGRPEHDSGAVQLVYASVDTCCYFLILCGMVSEVKLSCAFMSSCVWP